MMDEPHVTEGRAYHPGDTVILRLHHADAEFYRMVQNRMKELTDQTGVFFVVIGEGVEVVEPR